MNGGLEVAALLLQALFTIYQQEKMDQAQQEKFYQDEKTKFLANKPETLPDV